MGDVTFCYLIKHNISKRTFIRYCIEKYSFAMVKFFSELHTNMFVRAIMSKICNAYQVSSGGK